MGGDGGGGGWVEWWWSEVIIGGVVGIEEHYWRGVRWRLLGGEHQVRSIYGEHVRGREGFIGGALTILDT